jgi:hypothetical protein
MAKFVAAFINDWNPKDLAIDAVTFEESIWIDKAGTVQGIMGDRQVTADQLTKVDQSQLK